MSGNHPYGGGQVGGMYPNANQPPSGNQTSLPPPPPPPLPQQQQMHGHSQQGSQQSNMMGSQQPSGASMLGSNSGQGSSNVGGSQQLPKEVNSVSLCRLGQEIVHDTVQRAADIFSVLKTISLPNGMSYSVQQHQEKKNKLDDHMRMLNLSFRKLRIISEKVKESTNPKEAMLSQENVIPLNGKDYDIEALRDGEKNNLYQIVCEEHRDIVEKIQLKSRQLKEIIDHIRTIIWEINTMITMRKTG